MNFISVRPFSFRRGEMSAMLARALWLAVALLHGWLICRRFAMGAWDWPLDFVRAGLCMGGVAYACLKFWRISTVLDRTARRAFAFALILMLGHGLIAAPNPDNTLLRTPAAMSAVTLVTAVAMFGAAILIQASRGTDEKSDRRAGRPFRSVSSYDLAHLPLSVARGDHLIFRRPPPSRF